MIHLNDVRTEPKATTLKRTWITEAAQNFREAAYKQQPAVLLMLV